MEAAFSSDQPEKVGYTHLIGAAKKNQEMAQRIEKRVAKEYPAQYERCLRYLSTVNFLPTVTSNTNPPNLKGNLLNTGSTLPEDEKMPVEDIADTTIVDNQALVELFTQLSSTLRDRLAKQALFVNAAPSDLDKTLVYFALQDIFHICSMGIVQAKTNKINLGDAFQLILVLAEYQRALLRTLDQHGEPSSSNKTSFINEYHRRLSLLQDEASADNFINMYLTQQRIIAWLRFIDDSEVLSSLREDPKLRYAEFGDGSLLKSGNPPTQLPHESKAKVYNT
jgi:hypothetical protein